MLSENNKMQLAQKLIRQVLTFYEQELNSTYGL